MGRQMIAPGASPGFACEYQQPRRGVRNSYAPTGLILALMVIPRLAPSAIVFRRYAAGGVVSAAFDQSQAATIEFQCGAGAFSADVFFAQVIERRGVDQRAFV